MTRLRVEIESLRVPAGDGVDRDRLARALQASLGGEQARPPGLTALERAVVARVAAEVDRAVPPGTRSAVVPGAGAGGGSRPEHGRRP